jgi:catechol 2,3-dioxygenase-like lactoylglutathione lyase family enzyme
MGIKIDRIDHVVINCRDVEAIAAWYERVLGMQREVFGADRRTALKFGSQKLNLRPTGPVADWPTGAADAPGSLDFCFVSEGSAEDIVEHLRACGVAVDLGPVVRAGALGPMTSVYCAIPRATWSRSRAIAGPDGTPLLRQGRAESAHRPRAPLLLH